MAINGNPLIIGGTSSNRYLWSKKTAIDPTYLSSGKLVGRYYLLQDAASTSTAKVWYYSSTVSVDEDGKVILSNPSNISVKYNNYSTAQTTLRGKFIAESSTGSVTRKIPSDAEFSRGGNGSNPYWVSSDSYQIIKGTELLTDSIMYITTSDSSTYSEDEKIDGYWYKNYGQINNLLHLGYDATNLWIWEKYTAPNYSLGTKSEATICPSGTTIVYANDLTVFLNGTPSLGVYRGQVEFDYYSFDVNDYDVLKGNFLYGQSSGNYYFIPTDATFSRTGNVLSGYLLKVDKAQLITSTAGVFSNYIANFDKKRYPSSGILNNYWYERKGKIEDIMSSLGD